MIKIRYGVPLHPAYRASASYLASANLIYVKSEPPPPKPSCWRRPFNGRKKSIEDTHEVVKADFISGTPFFLASILKLYRLLTKLFLRIDRDGTGWAGIICRDQNAEDRNRGICRLEVERRQLVKYVGGKRFWSSDQKSWVEGYGEVEEKGRR